MRRVLIIGIGAGDPEQVTVQAIRALNQADVFFVIDKGTDKQDLVLLRQEICERYIENDSYRMVHAPDPERDRGAAPYRPAVEEWRRQRSELYERLIADELADGECGAFLVWGDPALYDSTLAIVGQIVARGALQLEYEVIPGISSVQALAARHRVSLTQVGKPVHITTGRRLAGRLPEDCDDVVVMLDASCSFTNLDEDDLEIYWGAYVGTKDEILVSGRLSDVSERIQAIRAEARARKGWIMDTYLLRRTGPAQAGDR
jgi:precorrin-6A synthase